MESNRIHNFNPGPAALPEVVLEEIQASFLNYGKSGMSVVELSHRSRWFEEIINDAVQRTRRLLNIGDDFTVLFLQGGASLQFTMVPMNLLAADRAADYVDTGTWSTKAVKEAQTLGKTVNVAASSADRNYAYIPKDIEFKPDAAYVHITSNNTIKGTQWSRFPDTGKVAIVSDMSSDILSRRFDPAPFGLIYAGAQKNIGPAGVCMVIIRGDILQQVPESLPTMLKYTTYAAKNSLYNTPPCFAIYTVQLVLKWLEESVGGLDPMEALNREKAGRLYSCLDATGFYRPTADADSRSLMNVTFRLANEDLEQRFVEQAQENSLAGLKGHRSVGGCRASIYNATCLNTVDALVAFMQEFERKHG